MLMFLGSLLGKVIIAVMCILLIVGPIASLFSKKNAEDEDKEEHS